MKYLFFLCLLFSSVTFSQNDTAAYPPVEYPENYKALIDVVYVTVDGWEGRMDIYYPEKVSQPVPVVINIHGGGWRKGVKESQRGFNDFFKMGWAVANVEYRLAPKYTAPSAIEDCKCALIYLVNHSEEFNINRNKIVTMGSSAGGHLALTTGLIPAGVFDNNCTPRKEYRVAAVINKYGITDVSDLLEGKKNRKEYTVVWLGEKWVDEDFVNSLSPISYVDENTPPVITIHGDADPTVPYQHAVLLKSKLDEKNVPNKLVTIPGGLHGKFPKELNDSARREIITFLKEHVED